MDDNRHAYDPEPDLANIAILASLLQEQEAGEEPDQARVYLLSDSLLRAVVEARARFYASFKDASREKAVENAMDGLSDHQRERMRKRIASDFTRR